MTRTNKEQPLKVAAFLEELIKVYMRYDLSLAHEDGQGAFIVEAFCLSNVDWLRDAENGVRKERPGEVVIVHE